MPGTGERAYAYAKACGIIGKSFVSKRVAALGNVSRLSELDRLVFPNSSRDLPEKELLVDLEIRINKRAVDSIKSVVDSFRNPPEFLVLLVRSWEYQDLKNALTALESKDPVKPVFSDLGRFGTINFSAWPELPDMLRNTDYEFILKLMEDKSRDELSKNSGISLQTELDCHYYNSLWKALRLLKQSDRKVSEKILSEEISLRNIVWALRLRTYYRMEPAETRSHLIDINTVLRGKPVSLAADAISSLELPLDSHQAWAAWKRLEFLNPETPEWKADPRYFQNAAAQYLYRMARHSFRSRPSSLDTLFCFIKIKQFEEDVLTSSTEGLGMGMVSRDVFSMMGIES